MLMTSKEYSRFILAPILAMKKSIDEVECKVVIFQR